MPVLLTQHSQKHAAPPVVPNSQSRQCGSKGAERLGRFKWGPGQYNCQQRGLRGALQLLCSSTAEEIEILPGRFFARFLRIKKAHPPTTGLPVVPLQATPQSEAIKNHVAPCFQALPGKTKTRDRSRASVWVDWFYRNVGISQHHHICPYGANISYAQRISYTAVRYISYLGRWPKYFIADAPMISPCQRQE